MASLTKEEAEFQLAQHCYCNCNKCFRARNFIASCKVNSPDRKVNSPHSLSHGMVVASDKCIWDRNPNSLTNPVCRYHHKTLVFHISPKEVEDGTAE